MCLNYRHLWQIYLHTNLLFTLSGYNQYLSFHNRDLFLNVGLTCLRLASKNLGFMYASFYILFPLKA